MPSVAIRLDSDLQNRLKNIADNQDRSPHYLMKKAVENFVVQEEKEAEERRIVLERLAEYERTGEYIDADKVREWAASLPGRTGG